MLFAYLKSNKTIDMGILLKKTGVNSLKKDNVTVGKFSSSVKTSEKNVDLYKSIDKFAWKDETKRDLKLESIEAYKEFAF